MNSIVPSWLCAMCLARPGPDQLIVSEVLEIRSFKISEMSEIVENCVGTRFGKDQIKFPHSFQ